MERARRGCGAPSVRSRESTERAGFQGTGTGKDEALAATIPDTDRIALIEETSEILLEKPNYVRFEARKGRAPFGGTAPLPPVTIADLLRATLRHRPDRIIVGEVRGAEAFDLLQALNTERLGSMTTIHALPLSRRSHDSRTTVSTPGRLGCHMEASESRSRSI